MRQLTNGLLLASLVALATAAGPATLYAQTHDHRQPGLTEPGNDVFGTIQEVVHRLEADPDTDWTTVDLETLRQHLIDMRNFTLKVDVLSQKPLPDGVQLTVESTTEDAAASLKRVLKAHPPMLEQETGWTMEVDSLSPGKYRLTVTSPRTTDAEKIQGLGYIGLMAAGGHHKRHHWMIATGQHPHDHSHTR